MKQLFLWLFLPAIGFASFDENTRRYLSGPELLWSLHRVLPHSELLTDNNYGGCRAIDTSNNSALGVADPRVGEAISPNPHTGTIQWLQLCVTEYFVARPELYAPWVQIKSFYGLDFFNALRLNAFFKNEFGDELQWKKMPLGLSSKLFGFTWEQYSETEKEALMRGLIFSILGPDEVIFDFGFTTKDRLLKAYVNRFNKFPKMTTFEVIKVASLNLILREEFLSY